MDTKKCFKCKDAKPLNEFYKHAQMADGHLGKCRKCTKQDATDHRNANIETILAYDRKRGNLPHRVEARRLYAQTSQGKSAIKRAHRRYRDRYPEKYAARTLLGNAVRDGRIEKPEQCSLCPSTDRIQGHHEDYCKPLEVIWACEKCHRKLENK